MSYVIDDVATYLAANGVGTLGVDIFESFLPPSPNAAIAVLETAGLKPDIYIPTKDPSFQILVRDGSYPNGRTKLDLIRSLLHNQYNVQLVVGGIYFYFIQAVSDGGHIGQDEQGRDEWSMNFQCHTR